MPSRNTVIGRPFLALAASILAAGLALDLFLQHQLMQRHRDHLLFEVTQELAILRARIEKEITANLLLIQGAAHFVALNPDLSGERWDSYARQAMREPNLLRNLTAAPDLIIAYVYPRLGNEAILGIDYRRLPEQWEQVRKARDSGRLVVAGPLALIQGGTGLVGRAPVMVPDAEGDRFWGLISAVLDIDRLFETVALHEFAPLRLAIRGLDGKGENGAVFFGDPALFEPKRAAIQMPIRFPAGSWQMAALPEDGWMDMPPPVQILHGLMALLLAVALFAAWRSVQHRETLARVRDSLIQAQAIAQQGSWEINHLDDRLWWSNETYRIFGLSPGNGILSSSAFWDLVHPDDRRRVEKTWADSFGSHEVQTLEIRIVRPAGSPRHVHLKFVNEYDRTGQPIRSVGTVQDVTDRINLELLKEDVERIARHDLKAPLNAIVGLPRVLELELDGQLSDEQREMLHLIQDSGLSMLNMVDLSLDLFRIETGTYQYVQQNVDALALTRRLTRQYRAILAGRSLDAVILADGQAPAADAELRVRADESLLYSMLGNLFANAIEAAPETSEIRLEFHRDARWLQLDIENRGAVPPAMRARFFEKYQTHGKRSGIGLGTYSAWIVARAMGFELGMTASDATDSTRVSVRMPLAPATPRTHPAVEGG